MTITDIKKTKRGRYALFNEDGFLFSIDGETLLASGLVPKDTIEPQVLEALRDKSDMRKVQDSALQYLSLRFYGETELYRKLLLKYDEHSAAAAVAKMCELGLLNDEEFATEKAKGMAQRGKSRREILQKLYSLGIDRDLAESAVERLPMDETRLACDLLEKKYLDVLRKGGREKVMAALARRGFSRQTIKEALAVVEEEHDITQNTWIGEEA